MHLWQWLLVIFLGPSVLLLALIVVALVSDAFSRPRRPAAIDAASTVSD